VTCATGSVTADNVCRWTYRSGVTYKVPVAAASPAKASTIAGVRALAGRDVHDNLPVLGKKICSLADAYASRFIARSFT